MKLRILTSVLSVLTFSAHAAAPGQYSVTSLGSMTGLDLNNKGQVVGYVTGSGIKQAALYTGGVVSTIAGTKAQSLANGINDAGQISGNFGANLERGFLYYDGGLVLTGAFKTVGIDNLGTLGGMVGMSSDGSYASALLYAYGDTTLVSLGGASMHPLGISKEGTLYGFGSAPDGAVNPFTYRSGVLTNYANVFGAGTLIGGVNERDQLLGTVIESGQHFIYSNGVTEYLPAGVGFSSINNSGWAVGAQQDVDTSGYLKGLLLIDGVSYDLNALIDPAAGWNITNAHIINENNQILAEGCNASGCGSLLLSPLAGTGPVAAVPEPETYGMMLLGMAAIGFAARRRRKQESK